MRGPDAAVVALAVRLTLGRRQSAVAVVAVVAAFLFLRSRLGQRRRDPTPDCNPHG
jgi:hypothetical protein